MLKTAEIPQTQVRETGTYNGKFALYEAFRNLTDSKYVKESYQWRRTRSNRWIGGVTAPWGIENLTNDPISVLLRESKGIVQLLVVNRDGWKMDEATTQQESWDFPEIDDSVILDAKFIKGGKYKGKTFITYNDPTSANPETTNPMSGQFDETAMTISLIHQLAFEESLKALLAISTKSYPYAQIMTSPVWRNHVFGPDSKNLSREQVINSLEGFVKV